MHVPVVGVMLLMSITVFGTDPAKAAVDPCQSPSAIVTDVVWWEADPWTEARAIGVNDSDCWLDTVVTFWRFLDAGGNEVWSSAGMAEPDLVAPGADIVERFAAEGVPAFDHIEVTFNAGSTGGDPALKTDWPITVTDKHTFVEDGKRWFEWTVNTHGRCNRHVLFADVIAYDAAGELVTVVFGGSAGTCTTQLMQARIDSGPSEGIASWTVTVWGEHLDVTESWWASWNNYFEDIRRSSFAEQIVWLANEGITGGCAQNRFCPTASVTREQMASFLARALDLPPTGTDYFTDDETSSHEIAINRLAASGITGGCAAGKFCPKAVVTRAQMAAFLDRAFELGPTDEDFFSDDETSSHEASINRLAASGITGGCASGLFCPTTAVTRGQMAAFLRRALP
ncbi:MAG TPA: S-layer homology domain-containing protein [Candidatus Limnocylindrales bacterium]|nr:S-layer homology domain-containing protein [Candidatus Limnocylindrales bacterium]